MMQYARAFAAAVECELSNGDLPFEEQELYQRITDQVQALPKKNVRLIGLHVWHKGAISSRSMLAVKGEPGTAAGNPTVPAMPAVSQTREKTVSAPGAHTATTMKPPEAKASSSAAPNRPSLSAQSSAALQAPASAAAPASTTRPTANSAPAARMTAPAPAARPAPPTPGLPNRPPPGASGSSTRYSAGTPRSAAPAAPAAPSKPAAPSATSSAQSPAARMVSGVVPAVEPRIVRSKSGFSLALEHCTGNSAEDVGRSLAQPVRDHAADVLMATLGALHGTLSDPLSLLDGRVDEELRRNLVGEACVYVCYVLYEALTRTSLPQMQSILVVQGACMHALMDQNMPVSELSRYLATESPREEFSGRICTLFDVRETPEMQQRVEAHLRALRLDVRSCVEQIEQRLSQGKAHGEQKTG